MSARTISQKKFSKLVSSTGALSQPPGALTRLSNLLFTQRGSLQVADGSSIISQIANYILAALAPFTNNLLGQYPWYVALAYSPIPQVPNVTGFAAVPNYGVNNPAGLYTFAITATIGAGHTAAQQVQMLASGTIAGVSFSWNAATGATGYNIYILYSFRIGHQTLTSYVPVQSAGAVTSSTFTGVLPTGLAVFPPITNTTYGLQLFIGSPTFASSYVVGFLAAASGPFPFAGAQASGSQAIPIPANIVPGGPEFTYPQSVPGFSPYGGLPGSAGPLPQIIQFAGKSILLLGNAYPPQQVDPSQGSGATATPLYNTFQAAYPTWQATVAWTTGAQLTAAAGTINYLFTATQGGVSGATAPSWNFTLGAETSDNSVIWTCNGPIVASIAPIGAAHAVAYAGSLWLANTWPVNTQYPAWSSGATQTTGQQIVVYDGSGNPWLFTAQVGGVAGGSAPAWIFTANTTTTDGTITWYNNGQAAPALVAGIDGPSCIKMSNANNPNSWNPVNVAFIGRDDGTQITGLQPFTIAALGISPTGSLCVFKEFTTYQVIGVFGSTSFEIQPAQTNLGCIAARSIQFLPGFGVVRFTHLGFAVFDGINDRLISEDIRPYLFGGVDSESDFVPVDPSFCYLSQAAQTIAPPMYLCAMPLVPGFGQNGGSLTRVFCYDLVMKSWAVLDLPWAITTLSAISVGEGYPLVLAGKTDGTIQRIQSGDANWQNGQTGAAPVAWSFRSPDVFGEGGSQRIFYQQAVIRGYGTPAMVQSIIAALWLDGTNLGSQAIDVVPTGDSTFEANVKIFLNGQLAHLDVSGSGGPGVIDSIDWSIVPKSSQARRVIS